MELPPDIDAWITKTWPRHDAIHIRSKMMRFHTEQQMREATPTS